MNCGNEKNCEMYGEKGGCDGIIRYDLKNKHYFAGSEGTSTCYYSETLTMNALGLEEKINQTKLLENRNKELRAIAGYLDQLRAELALKRK